MPREVKPWKGGVANSTLVRRREIDRGSSLARGAGPARSTTRIAPHNAERAKKRATRKAAKAARARRSPGYRAAMERAGGRCEWMERHVGFSSLELGHGEVYEYATRCTVTEGLQAHHLTYARYGGDELPEDFVILCETHHALVETRDHPHRQRNRRGAA